MARILLLIPSMTGVGGTERMVHSLSALLKGMGHEVHQASFDAPGQRRHFASDTPLHQLGPVPRLPLPFRPFSYLLAARRLRRLKARIGVDVTISNLWGADLINAMASKGDRRVALAHINVAGNPANARMMQFLPIVGAIYRRMDHVVAVTEPLATELRGLYGLPHDRCTCIHNFVARSTSASVLPKDGVQRFVWCGRLSSEKNVEGLLHAWAAFCRDQDHVQLVLVGSGPEETALREAAQALTLRTSTAMEDSHAQVVFAGHSSDPAAYMAGARALLLSSHVEGLPMVVLEALALGIPVLAADCPAGGVRSALAGTGECDPDRSISEITPAGVLLPIPRAGSSSLDAWKEALSDAAADEVQWARWCDGAAQRGLLFDGAEASRGWGCLLGTGSAHRGNAVASTGVMGQTDAH